MFVNPTEEKETEDDAADTLIEEPIAYQEPSSGSLGQRDGDEFGLPAGFFQQFQSPPKKELSHCTDMVPWQGPVQGLHRSNAKSNLEEEDPRPRLKRQFAKSNFDLDAADWQTLARALEQKSVDENALAQGSSKQTTKTSPKKAKASPKKAKAKAKKKATSKATKDKPPGHKDSKTKKKPLPTAAQAATPKKKKSTFRHRKTSSAYHSAKNAALKAGFSPMSACAKGQEASHRIGEQIDQGLLKEE